MRVVPLWYRLLRPLRPSDWPLDRFGRGDIALRVPPGRWSDAEELLGVAARGPFLGRIGCRLLGRGLERPGLAQGRVPGANGSQRCLLRWCRITLRAAGQWLMSKMLFGNTLR
jgi:hypothetical protein